MLRVNRLSRANLYLLYIHSEIILLLYCSLKSNEPNIYVSSGSLLLLYFIVVKKHDGTREKGQLHPRVSPGRFRIFMGLRSEIGQFVTKLGSKKKQDLTSRHVVYCVYIYVLFDCYIDRINHVMDERVLTHRRKSDKPLFLSFFEFRAGRFYIFINVFQEKHSFPPLSHLCVNMYKTLRTLFWR